MPRSRKPAGPFRYFNSSPEIIRLVVMIYVRFPLSLRNLEDLPAIPALTSATRPGGVGGTGARAFIALNASIACRTSSGSRGSSTCGDSFPAKYRAASVSSRNGRLILRAPQIVAPSTTNAIAASSRRAGRSGRGPAAACANVPAANFRPAIPLPPPSTWFEAVPCCVWFRACRSVEVSRSGCVSFPRSVSNSCRLANGPAVAFMAK
jgi:hypothetical protein